MANSYFVKNRDPETIQECYDNLDHIRYRIFEIVGLIHQLTYVAFNGDLKNRYFPSSLSNIEDVLEAHADDLDHAVDALKAIMDRTADEQLDKELTEAQKNSVSG